MNKPSTMNPIHEFCFEARFETALEWDDIYGLMYKPLKKDHGNSIRLPLCDLPESVRKREKAFYYKPLYTFSSGNIHISIGSHVILLNNTAPYLRWDVLLPKVKKMLSVLFDTIKDIKVNYTSVNYVNFFDVGTLDEFTAFVDLSVVLDKLTVKNLSLQVETVFSKQNAIINIANNLTRQHEHSKTISKFSVLDINFFKQLAKPSRNLNRLVSSIDTLHRTEKKLFFRMIKPEAEKRYKLDRSNI